MTTVWVVVAVLGLVALQYLWNMVENLLGNPDGKVLKMLRRVGSDLSKPHEIDFFMHLPTRQAAEKVAAVIQKDGFTATVEGTESDELPWVCHAKKTMCPSLGELHLIRARLDKVTSAYGGEYNGWGTPVEE